MATAPSIFSGVATVGANVNAYGADPTGVADSTAAFTRAYASGAPVIVPYGKYIVGACAVPNFSCLRGYAATGYTSDNTTSGLLPVISIKAGAASVFNVASNYAWEISGVFIYGNGTGSGITGGGENGVMMNCTVNNFSYGIGDTSDTTNDSTFINCQVSDNGSGYTGLQDCNIIGGAITANGLGANMYAGSNNMTAVRVEWNTGVGVEVTGIGAASLSITGGLFDGNSSYGLQVASSGFINVSNAIFRRSGRALATGNAHISLSSATNCIFTGIQTAQGVNDDGSGSPSPTNSINFAGTNTQIQFVGCYLRGNVSGTYNTGTVPTTDYVLSGCLT